MEEKHFKGEKMKRIFLSLILIISLAITSLTLSSCTFTLNENGEVNGVKYENAENYSIGSCSFNYNEYDSIKINWVLGDIVVKQTENTTLKIYEKVKDADDDYKMHYVIENRVLKVQFWASGYTAIASGEEKALTIELPNTTNADIVINTVSSNIICDGELKLNSGEFDTVSGDMDIYGVTANKVLFVSISGNIKVKKLTVNDAAFGTISGNVDISLKSVQTLDIETVSGNVILKINSVGATVVFETVSGTYTANQKDGIYGNGLAQITVGTISGNLSVN